MSTAKPVGITGLDAGHALYSDIGAFFEFGQLDKDLVSDTALTTTAALDTDADLNECRIFDDPLKAVGETITFNGGGETIVFVMKVSATRGSGLSDADILTFNSGGHRLDLYLYAGLRLETKFRGGVGATVTGDTADVADQAELDGWRCVAFTFSETGGIESYVNGVSSASTTATTSAFTQAINVNVLPNTNTDASFKVAAIIKFNSVLSAANLASITNDPYQVVSAAPVFDVDSVNNASPQPGDSVVFTLINGTGPYTATLDGQALPIAAQDANTCTITWPDPRTFGNRALTFGVFQQVAFTDSTAAEGAISVTTDPIGEYVTLSNPDTSIDSLVYDDQSDMATGDSYHARWISGGNGQSFPISGSIDQMDLPAGDHVVETAHFQDYGNGYRTWSDSFQLILRGSSPGLAVESITVSPDGLQTLIVFNESISIGAGGSGGLTLDMTLGSVTGTYVSGDGTDTFTFSNSRTILSNETGSASYVNPGDGLEAVDDGEDVVITAVSTTNGSTVAPVVPTITTQPQSQSAVDGNQVTFTVAANTGGLADPVTYQWTADGSNIPGATSASYQVTANLANNNGTVFRCVVTSSQNGVVTSDPATLTVTAAQTRITTGQFVDRSVVPNTVMASETINYRVRNGAGAIVHTGSLTTDLSGNGQVDSNALGTVGETVYFEVLHPDNSYSGFQVTLAAAS